MLAVALMFCMLRRPPRHVSQSQQVTTYPTPTAAPFTVRTTQANITNGSHYIGVMLRITTEHLLFVRLELKY